METTITTSEHPLRSVCVYCASSTKIPAIYFEVANELGRLLGELQLNVVNGAGNIGLMRAVSDATERIGRNANVRLTLTKLGMDAGLL